MKLKNYIALSFLFLLFATPILLAQSNIRLLMVDPDLDRITIKNFGTSAEDISNYRLCARFAYTPDLLGQSIVSGSFNLMPNAEVTLDITINLNANSSDFGLYLPFTGSGGFANPNLMVDFTQWGAGGIGRESVAVMAGLWSTGDFIDPPGPYTYIGDGNQNGVTFWQNGGGGFDCPALMANFGDPCDDGDPCTENDMVQLDCTCTGVFQDSDNDGTCDANDLCPGGPEPGTACDDNDDCTINDMIQPDCSCAGTFQDSDDDGTCDAQDQCPDSPEPGTTCDDGDDCTTNDMIQADCSCAGTFQDSDDDGTCDAEDQCPDSPEPGTACDDGDDCTTNDLIQPDCSCAGTFQDSDDDGTCDAQDQCPDSPEPGTACDDGDDCTTNDMIQPDCSCAGTFQDSDDDGTCDAEDQCQDSPEPGTACDDDDDCTTNDLIQPDCSCAGTFQDSDDDGTCDAQDQCPDSPEPGTACDDDDDCTTNDLIQPDCSCAGTFQDSDDDGTCDAQDQCPDSPEPGTACDDGDDCTTNDLIQADCSCAGTLELPGIDAGQADTLNCITDALTLNASVSNCENCTFAWTTADGNIASGADTASPTVTAAGIYLVSVTNEDTGCTEEDSVEIAETPPPHLTLSSFQNIACNGSSTGAARVDVIDGKPPYTYLWSNGSEADFINNVLAGFYSVTVTDADNCQDALEVNLTQPPFLELSISGTNETALGAGDGTATATVEGGVPPYQYNWSNGTNSEVADSLDDGEYHLTVMDQNGCNIMGAIVINPFDCPTIFIDSEYTPLICPGSNSGSASIVGVPGANHPVSYSWSTGATDSTINNLPGGMYLVTITDSTNCAVIDVFEINEGDPQGPAAVARNITVQLDENGTASITPMDIDDGSSDNCGIESFQISQSQFDCSDLGQQSVTLTVTDSVGNFSIDIATVHILDDQVPTITNCPSDITIIDCATVVDYGTLNVLDNCEVSLTLLEGLESGSLFPVGITNVVYEVEDGAGNTAMCAFTVTIESDLTFEASTTPVSCNGGIDGQIEIIPSGGTPPYTISGIPATIPAGSYEILVTDSQGCTVVQTIMVTEPPVLEVILDDITPETNMQSDGQVFITATGGTGILTFNWTDQEGNDIGTTEDISGLAAGTYFVWVTDENDCFIILEVMVDQITAVNESLLEKQISVFPNPNNGQFAIQTDFGGPQEVSIVIFDVNGKTIRQQHLDFGAIHFLIVDLFEAQSGLFTIEFIVGGQVIYKRVLISN